MLAADSAGDISILGDYHNENTPVDVNDDGALTASDAMWVINALLANGPVSLAAAPFSTQAATSDSPVNGDGSPGMEGFVDVDGDRFLSPLDAIMVINALNEVDENDIVKIRLDVTDAEGNSLDSVTVGDEFFLNVFVDDIRDEDLGVFAGFVDVMYDANLADVNGSIVIGSDYPITNSGNSSQDGLLDEVGGAGESLSPLGGDERLLFRAPFVATEAGTLDFITDPADSLGREFLVYGRNTALASDEVNFGSFSLTVNPLPTLSVGDATVTEGDGGTVNLEFIVTLSEASDDEVTVEFATSEGTATSGDDFVANTGTLTFAPGTTTQTVTVQVQGDTVEEANETLSLLLRNATNASIDDDEGLGTIIDDDSNIVVSIESEVSITEGDNGTPSAEIVVTLNQASANTVTVDFATTDGTALAGEDYTATTGTLTFDPGETQKTITVPILDDDIREAEENFAVDLSNPTGATIDVDRSVVTVADDDPDDPLALRIADVTENERDDVTFGVTVTVRLSAPSTETVTVDIATSDGTATAGSDYVANSQTLTFNPGETTASFTVDVVGDTIFEADETFFATLSNASGADIEDGEATVTLANDDPQPTISIDDVNVVEGDSGLATAVFTVSLSGASDSAIMVDFATAGDTAIEGTDYVATSGTLTFAPGETSKQITVNISGDTDDEPDETFFVNLSSPGGATITDGQGLGTIQNDDDAVVPTISVADADAVEGDDAGSAGQLTFVVTLSEATTSTVTVDFATSDGAAVAGEDYVSQSGTLTFAPGETSKTIVVDAVADTTEEPIQSFALTLSSPTNATIADSQAIGTIRDDDGALPAVSINDITVNELTDTIAEAIFTVSLSQISQQDVSVQFATENGSAIAGDDYESTAGTVTIEAGSSTAEIRVFILTDGSAGEPEETFRVNLSSAQNATIDDGEGLATILDRGASTQDRVRVRLQIANSAGQPINTVNSGDNFFLQLFVEDWHPNPQGVVQAFVDLEYDETLVEITGDIDFAAAFLNNQSGDTSVDGIVDELGAAIDPNNLLGAGEHLLASIPMRATANGRADFTLNPADNPLNGIAVEGTDQLFVDPANVVLEGAELQIGTPPSIDIMDASISEGDTTNSNMTFTVTLSRAADSEVTVNFTTGGGTATPGVDYIGQSGSVTFAPGETSKTITIQVIGDDIPEDDETFQVTLSGGNDVAITDGLAVGTILDDEPMPTLSIEDVSIDEGDTGVTTATFTVALSIISEQDVTFDFQVVGVTATEDVDFQTDSGSLTINAGQSTATITVQIETDTFFEEDETFEVRLSNPVNAGILDGTAVGTITNDDPEGSQPGSISGFVYADTNNNGVRDSNEVGIPGITVTLVGTTDDTNAQVNQTVTTTSTGSYSFQNLVAGTYTIRETQSSFYVDGRDTVGNLGHVGPRVNDQFTLRVEGDAAANNYNFGQAGIKSQFLSKRAATSSVTAQDLVNSVNPDSPGFWFRLSDIPSASASANANANNQAAGPPPATSGFRVSGSELIVTGTEGDDTFHFSVDGNTLQLELNGETREFGKNEVSRIVFNGGGGNDEAFLTGGSGRDMAELFAGGGTLASDDYLVQVNDVARITAVGGGGDDSAVLRDSAFADHLEASGNRALLSRAGLFANVVEDFETVTAISQNSSGNPDTKDISATDFVLEEQGNWFDA